MPEYNTPVPEFKTPVPEYNDVWANFNSKKIISCNPRPTLDEIYLDHRRPQHPNREVKRETLEKKIVFQDTRRRKPVDKDEEYCLNLGRFIVSYHLNQRLKHLSRNLVQLDQGSSLGEVSVRQQDELLEELHHPAEDQVR